jgi:DNA/RNA-binding domain of Phe-tRNA-synthetase-like protein
MSSLYINLTIIKPEYTIPLLLINAYKHMSQFADFNNKEIFTIDDEVRRKYPSINIGIAVIKNVRIEKSNPELRESINEFINSRSALTNEEIGSYPEIISYRKVYKEMGVDWHSKRPSPEALLRRISKGKSLYQINTCVDAYNLVVMRNRVSSGAFDLDKISFPTVLRFPKEGEKILLLGDEVPTKYDIRELAYFDNEGGYNIDLNYRDAQRTAVSTDTKNILINIDGIYEITREQVKKTLQETIEEIIKYCGGTLETAGILSV